VGLLLASWAKRLVMGLLKLVKVEDLSKSAGVDKYLSKAEIKLAFVVRVFGVYRVKVKRLM